MIVVAKRIVVAVLALGTQVFGTLAGTAGAADLPSYKPPSRGAPAGRVGMGTRGIVRPPQIWALAPEHIGLTTREQPSLYWYSTKSMSARIELVAINNRDTKTILEESVGSSASPGIQRIDLARYGIRLRPGIEYRWSLSSETDPKQRSNNGWIRRVDPGSGLAKRIEATPVTGHAAIYAEEGIWYDAIATASELIEQSPGDIALRTQRAALLEQVGLKEAAADDARR